MQSFIDWLFYDPTHLITGLFLLAIFFSCIFAFPFLMQQWLRLFPPPAVYNAKDVTARHIYASTVISERDSIARAYRQGELSSVVDQVNLAAANKLLLENRVVLANLIEELGLQHELNRVLMKTAADNKMDLLTYMTYRSQEAATLLELEAKRTHTDIDLRKMREEKRVHIAALRMADWLRRRQIQ